jgi:hypothetical protein
MAALFSGNESGNYAAFCPRASRLFYRTYPWSVTLPLGLIILPPVLSAGAHPEVERGTGQRRHLERTRIVTAAVFCAEVL